MRFLAIFTLLFSASSFAGIPTEINPENIKEMGVEVVSWHEIPSQEIIEYKEHLLCTPVTVFFPLTDSKHPEYTRAAATAVINLNGRPLAFPTVSISKTENGERNYAKVCAPLNSGYKVDITYSFNPPEDAELIPMCPPSYILHDIERYIDKEAYK